MPEPKKEKITEEQANEALQQLTAQAEQQDDEEEVQVQQAVKEEGKPEAEQPATEERVETAEGEPQAEEVAAETDDVASLKKRIEEAEARSAEKEKLFESRWRAFHTRQATNEQILRDRYLRKSSLADRALQVLKKANTELGLSGEDVDRVIQELSGSMHPASASYVAPTSTPEPVEDQAIVLNSFLNERGMTTEEADEFGKWIRSEGSTALSPMEQAVANQSLDGFLRIAHGRWQEGVRERDKGQKRTDVANAVAQVKRVQKEAGKAASATSAAPKKQPAGPKTTVDTKKLTDADISALLRASVEQYR